MKATGKIGQAELIVWLSALAMLIAQVAHDIAVALSKLLS